ncbi:MAG: DUF1801 domain-containing protein [Myxococcota bacterium]|nr:DUF1801 domain-containing protein [Deltaproteobacteria bacterium]MDQ3333539.1 DUF1801 domain-containing protein [Myxococcota bacterium]
MPRRKQVDAWFAKYENPMKPVVQAMRDVILAADPRIDECIKWSAPTFTYEGNLASFFPRSKQHASLMFHQGASIPGKHARLEGTGVGRVMKIASVVEVGAAGRELAAIVRAWCDSRDAKTKAPAAKTKAAPKKKPKRKKKPVAKKPAKRR